MQTKGFFCGIFKRSSSKANSKKKSQSSERQPTVEVNQPSTPAAQHGAAARSEFSTAPAQTSRHHATPKTLRTPQNLSVPGSSSRPYRDRTGRSHHPPPAVTPKIQLSCTCHQNLLACMCLPGDECQQPVSSATFQSSSVYYDESFYRHVSTPSRYHKHGSRAHNTTPYSSRDYTTASATPARRQRYMSAPGDADVARAHHSFGQ